MDNLGPSQAFDFYGHGIGSGQKGLYTPFLGPPAREEKMSSYNKRSTAKFNMPESYVGENEVLGDTMEDFMFTSMYDWYTERALPWYKTDQIHFQWTEWENNPHYMGITPHQAPSKLVTQKRTIRRASIVRRGIACEFEHDFVATSTGRSSFMASLAQMARSIQETANVEVIRALLHCHRYQQIYIRKYGVVKDYELDEWLDRKATRFMIAQKHDFGLERLSVAIESEQEQYDARSDMWILNRKVFDYTSVVPEGKIYYDKGGQEAVDRINGRRRGRVAAGGTMGNVRSLEPERLIADTPVFIAKSYNVESIGKADLMSRVTEIGVYNKMIDRCTDYSRYSSESRNIRVYDNDIDAWSDIEFAFALERCGVWADNGKLAPIYTNTKRGRSHAAAATDEYDFLSYPKSNGERTEIEYIGDMSLEYQNEKDMLDAAQTMLNSLSYGDGNEARRLMSEMDRLATNGIDGDNDINAVNRLAGAIRNLVGEDNFFMGAGDAAVAFRDNFITGTFRKAVPVGRPDDDRNRVMSSVSDKEQEFLTEIMGAALHKSYQSQVSKIASQTNTLWQDRAADIKKLVLNVQEENPSHVPAFRGPTDVDTWYNQEVKGFTQQMAQQMGDSVSSSAEVKYLPTGAALPKGYRWESDSHVTGLASMPAFKAYAAKMAGNSTHTNVSGNSRRTRIGAGAGNTGLQGAGPYDRSDDLAAARRRDRENRNTPPDVSFAAGRMVEQRFFNLSKYIDRISKSSAPRLLKWLAVIYAGSEFTRQRLVSYARNNIAVKLGLLLMRPHCTYKTQFGIKCLSGGGSGYTMFGHGNMQIEHEAARKVGLAHYTAYLSSVVMYPKNVYVVEDIYCEKYLGGMGVEFWAASKYKNKTAKRNSRSIICAPLPPSMKRVEQKIDIRGKWYTEHSMHLVAQERFDAPLYPGAGRINYLFGLWDGVRSDKGGRGRIPANYVCWQGVEWYFNSKAGRFDDFTPESGCMGNKVYPGCGKVRNGHDKLLETPAYLGGK